MKELTLLRTERNKTYDLGGNKRRIVSSVGAVHYKDNYADAGESWKDIDLTLVNGMVTKAPYILDLNKDSAKKYKLKVTDKRTGDIVEIKFKSKADASTPTDSDFIVTPNKSAVRLKLPHGSTVSITKSKAKSSIKLKHRADGEVEWTSLIDKDELSYDAVVQSDISVGPAGANDCAYARGSTKILDDVAFATGDPVFGGAVAQANAYNCGIRFDIGVLGTAVIDTAILKLYAVSVDTGADATIYAHDVDNAGDFAAITNVANTTNRPRTTANVAWSDTDTTTGWRSSPGMIDIFQELNDSGYDNNVVLLLINKSAAYNLFIAEGYGDAHPPLLEIDYTAGWANIASVNGALATGLASWCGAAVADIANMSGADV